MPHPGNVTIQVSIISEANFQFTEDLDTAAPAPRIAAVLAWVVLTGMPSMVASVIDRIPAASAASAWGGSSGTSSLPTF